MLFEKLPRQTVDEWFSQSVAVQVEVRRLTERAVGS